MTAPDTDLRASVTTDWRRLAPLSVVVEAIKPAGGLLLAGLVTVTLRGWDRMGWVEPVIGAVVVLGILALSAWAWATTTYRVTPAHVELRSGLLVRAHRSVARDRLRTVDVTVDLPHRLAGLAVVAIGTGRQGGDADDEVKLASVSAAEAERLREVLLSRAPSAVGQPAVGAPAVAAEPGVPLAVWSASWLRFAPLSLLGLVSLGVVAAALGQFRGLIDYRALVAAGPVRALLERAEALPWPLVVAAVLVALVVVNTVLSVVLYGVLYGGFRLTRERDATLRVRYGLLTTRSVTIDEARIRGVRLDEPLLLRAGGGARAKVIAAGLGTKGSDGQDKRDGDLLLPSVPAPLAHRVAADVLHAPESPLAAPLTAHPAAALRVLLVRDVPVAALPAAGLAVPALLGVFPHWPWQVALLLVPLAAGGAVLAHRNLGHALAGPFLVARQGAGVRRTAAVRTDGIIAWRFRRTVFQRRSGLLTVTAAVAAGKGEHTIPLADGAEVLAVADAAVPGLLAPFLAPSAPVRGEKG